ncbi:MAG TPA: PRC-barrel domain-containing protein [Patescibacteria group bacterium]|nr:PRC-barrel domain-containing protein [Patescibacteria group bacterium]
MKKLTLLGAVSALALLVAAPAMAETAKEMNKEYNQEESYGSRGKDSGSIVDRNQNNTEVKEDISDATAKASASMRNTADEIKASLIDEDVKVKASPVTIKSATTADGIIGKPVVNQANDRIATVEDVILDANGDAKLIVVKDGDFAGMGGKLAAFDYDAIISRQADGDVVMPITEQTLDKVAEFSYDKSDKDNVRVIPANGYSVKGLLDGNIVDAQGEKLATIDNVSLKAGKADMIIASYGKVLAMGGDKVALDFDTGRLVRDGKNVDLKLSQNQTAKFNTYKDNHK